MLENKFMKLALIGVAAIAVMGAGDQPAPEVPQLDMPECAKPEVFKQMSEQEQECCLMYFQQELDRAFSETDPTYIPLAPTEQYMEKLGRCTTS